MLNVNSSASLSCILFKTVSYNAALAGTKSGQVEGCMYLKSSEQYSRSAIKRVYIVVFSKNVFIIIK